MVKHCLLCYDTWAMLKEYNKHWDYQSKHCHSTPNWGKQWSENSENVKWNSSSQQNFFKKNKRMKRRLQLKFLSGSFVGQAGKAIYQGYLQSVKMWDFLKPIVILCIFHQQIQCGKGLNLSCALINPIVSVVDFIQSHGLNYHQFYEFLSEVETEYSGLPYHTVICLLSSDKVGVLLLFF